jgi:hypothetical protein
MGLTHALIAGKGRTGLLLVFLMCCLLFAGSSAQMKQTVSDAAKYQCYAHVFWFGTADFPICRLLLPQVTPALHTLPREYPLLSLAVFSIPLLAPSDWYQIVFGLLMVLLSAALYLYLAQVGAPGASLAFLLYLLLGCLGTAAARFDLAPAALTLACLICAERRRYQLAYLFLALATMLKFYPVLLILPLLLASLQAKGQTTVWRTLLRGMGLFLSVCGLFTVVSVLLNTEETLGPVTYFLQRPIQIESTSASVLWVASLLGLPTCTDYSFGSLNIYERVNGVCVSLPGQSPGFFTSMLSVSFVLLGLSGVVWVLWLQWRGKITLGRAFIMMLLVIMFTGKVFSSQYLLWVAPLLAYVEGIDFIWLVLWGGISVLTSYIYPYLYGTAGQLEKLPEVRLFYPAVLIRNVLLGAVVVTLLLRKSLSSHLMPDQETQASLSEQPSVNGRARMG